MDKYESQVMSYIVEVKEDLPLVDREYLLEKFSGKGGWTFAKIPEVKPNKKAYFNWVRVRGSIDDFAFKGYNMMPMGDGTMFFSVKAEIRKKIKKQAGDTVHIILYADHLPTDVPSDLIVCLKDIPGLYQVFENLRETEKKAHIDHIYSAKTDQTKADRIVDLIELLSK